VDGEEKVKRGGEQEVDMFRGGGGRGMSSVLHTRGTLHDFSVRLIPYG
jgi:hypothetical protein